MDIRNKKIVIVGLGKSGFDAAILAEKKGAIVAVTDSSDKENISQDIGILESLFVEVETGGHTEEFLSGADIIVVSPGISEDALPLRYAKDNVIPVISEIEFAYSFCKGKIMAVTGTNGKTTVVTLLGKIFDKAQRKYIVCGNIGNSFSGAIDNIEEDTFVILEVSSFQLEKIIDFKAHIGCMLNVSADHLERYASLQEYAKTKTKIFSNQDKFDIALVNYDDRISKELDIPGAGKKFFYSVNTEVEGAYMMNNVMFSKIDDKVKRLFDMPKTKLTGQYNRENICAASFMALCAEVDTDSIIEAVEEFIPLDHRLEKVYEKEGVTFIDDSKATNVDATKRALQSLNSKVVLIAGGRDKGGDYAEVIPEIKEKVAGVILLGESSEKIKEAIKKENVLMKEANSMQEAVTLAIEIVHEGEIVLLSPMCSSFDMYQSYAHRGEDFQRIVKEYYRVK